MKTFVHSRILGSTRIWSISLLIILPFLAFPGQNSPNTSNNFRHLDIPSYFVKNQGQFEQLVRYQFKIPSVNMWFYDNAVTYQFVKVQKYYHSEQEASIPDMIEIPKTNIYNLKLIFRDSNHNPTYLESEPLQSKSNYFIGNDQTAWTTDAINFKSLTYSNIYNNIDVKFYDSKNVLKNDYIVHPGGRLSDLKLTYEGATNVQLTEDGKLRLQTNEGLLFEHIPLAYQNINGITKAIGIKYSISDDNTIYFETTGFDSNFDLVIDPVLIYSTFLGGNGDEIFNTVTGIDKDSQGNLYITGRTGSNNFSTTPGSYDVTYNAGGYDVFVLKLNPSGTGLLYSTFLGGSDYDAGEALKLNQTTHDVIISGVSGSSNFPITVGAYQTTYAGGTYDAFIAKLNSTGNLLLFSTYIGSWLYNEVHALDVDIAGNIYCVGQSQDGFPVTPGCYQPTFGGGAFAMDVIVFKMNPTGTNLIYSTYMGGPLNDRGYNIKVDAQGYAYITGTTEGNFPVTPGAFQTTYGGGALDVFIAKLNPSGSALIYSTYLGGPAEDQVRDGFYLDQHKRVTIAGFAGAGFPTTAGAYDPNFNGGAKDAVIARLNNTGSILLFSTYLGGTGDDDADALDIAPNGDIFVAGLAGAGFPTTACAYDNTYNGNGDAYIARLDSTASNLLYSTYIGGSNNDFANAVIADGDSAFVVGTTVSSNFPVTAGAYDQTFNGGSHDLFALKISMANPVTASFNTPANYCVGQSATFVNTTSGTATYSWNFGDSTSSTLQNPTHVYNHPGNYTVILTITNACGTNSASHVLTIYPKPVVHLGNDTTLCNNMVLTLNPGPGNSSYLWQNGSTQQTFQVTSTGTYWVSVTNQFGCANTDSIHVNFVSGLNYTQNISICQGDSIHIGVHYYHLTGIYHDTINISLGCDSLITTNLALTPLPLVNLGPDRSMCQGDTVHLDAQNQGSTYLWSNNETSRVIIVQLPGTYAVTVTNTQGCKSADTCNVKLYPNPLVTIAPYNPVICVDSALTISAGGANNYSWSPPGYLSATTGSCVIATPPFSMTYHVTGMDVNGCSDDTSIFIKVLPLPVSSLDDSITACEGSSIDLDPGFCDSCWYQWSNGSTNRLINVQTPGLYWVKIYNPACRITDSIKVTECMEIWVPNVFTPNGDGLNETFHAKGIHVEDFEMFIFNRWGQQLCHTYDFNIGWDGRYKGKLCPDGVYYYLFYYRGPGIGHSIIKGEKHGCVTLLK